uniref:Uncharacterized protein n=1 Tax=Physcomitrium patens TaxID=3218 RepID=A0A7I3ZWY7_PHYPA
MSNVGWQLWDLHLSVIKPVVAHLVDDIGSGTLSCILFSEESPVILHGGSRGWISALRFVSTRLPRNIFCCSQITCNQIG